MLCGIKRIVTQYRGLPHQIYILLVARIIVAIGGFVYPFLTLFLSDRIGLSDQEIGVFLFIIALAYVPAAMIGGKLADKFNRKWIYFAAMVMGDICFLIAGFFCDRFFVVYLIIAGYFFMNMGGPVLSAMMMDLTRPANRQECYSLIYLGFNLGFAVGPLLAGMLFENYTRWIFWGEAALNFIAMVLIAIFVRDTRPDQQEIEAINNDEERAAEAASNESLLRTLLHSPIVIFFALFEAAYAFAYSQMGFVLPLQMEDMFGISAGARYYSVIWSLNGILVVILTPATVLLLKKKDPLLNLAFAGICFGIGLSAYAYTKDLVFIYALAILWTSGEVISATNSGVFIANHSPVSHRARYQSIYDIIQGSGKAIGPMVIGAYLTAGHSYVQVWQLMGLICAVAVVAFYVMYRLQKHKQHGPECIDAPDNEHIVQE